MHNASAQDIEYHHHLVHIARLDRTGNPRLYHCGRMTRSLRSRNRRTFF